MTALSAKQRDAIRELTYADWHLGCAAALLEDGPSEGLRQRADRLMLECVQLREDVGLLMRPRNVPGETG